MIRKFVASVILLIAIDSAVSAQRGMLDNHVGVRFGLGTGVTFQHLFTDHRGVELIALGRYGGLNLTGIYEFHQQFFDVRGFKWFIGGGGHVGIYSSRARYFENETGNSMTLGVDGIAGLEYFMHDIPLQISVDWKPAFNLVSTAQLFNEWDSGAISIRYRF